MAREKQYAVEVLEKYQHGRYGKEFYFGLYVPGFSKADAEAVAMETLASMTFEEIDTRCIDGHVGGPYHIWNVGNSYPKDKPIGFEQAEAYFTCRAYIEGR